jgi:hypothetical protein
MNLSFVGKKSDLLDYIEGLVMVSECDHECSSNCRREGCNCDCGEYHLSLEEAIKYE